MIHQTHLYVKRETLNLYEAAGYLGIGAHDLERLTAARRIPAERVRLATRRIVYRYNIFDLNAWKAGRGWRVAIC